VENVTVVTDARHQESIHVRLPEQRRNHRNDWRNVEVLRLSHLALMASSDVPLDVLG
jgi:hypothetical protein